MRLRLTIWGKLSLALLAATGLTVAVALGVSLYILTTFSEQETDRGLAEAVRTIRLILDLRQRAALGHAEILAGRDEVREAIVTGNRAALIRIGRRVMQEHELDFVIATDAAGIVLARPHAPEKFGDDASAMPTIRGALHGLPVATIRLAPIVRLGASAAAPVFERAPPYRLLGTVAAGFALNEAFVQELKQTIGHEVSFIMDNARLFTTLPAAGPIDPAGVTAGAGAGEGPAVRIEIAGQPYRAAYGALQGRDSTTPIGRFEVAKSEVAVRAARIRTITTMALAVGGGSLLILGLAVWLTSQLTRPLARLTQAAKAFGGGDLSQRVGVRGGDEVESLANAFNAMAAQIQQREAERTRAEAALRESEERFRKVFEEGPLGMVLADTTEGRFIRANAAFCRMLGYTEEEIKRRTFVDVTHPEHRGQDVAAVKELWAGRIPQYKTEKRYLEKNGETLWATLTTSLVRNDDGTPLYSLAMIEDITSRKQAEAELAEERQFLAALLDNIGEAVVACDARGVLTRFNQAARELHGLPEKPIPPEQWAEHYDLYQPDGQTPLRKEEIPLFRALQGERVREVEMVVAPRRGAARVLVANGQPMRVAGGRLLGAVVAMHDITAHKRAEEALKKLTETLEQRVAARTAELAERVQEVERLNQGMLNLLEDMQTANRQLEEATAKLDESNAELNAFAYSVSHDLRAPLRAMQGFSQALLEDYADRLDPLGQDYTRRLAAAAERMDTLIQDLLAYSRLSRTELELTPVSLEQVLEDALRQLETEIRARAARVTVEDPLPPVVGHRGTLVQLLANLVSNGVKFVSPGIQPQVRIWAEVRGAWSVEREASSVERGASGAMVVRIWVEDNGIGIAPHHQDRIFRVFERLHGLEAYPGTGIGLAIVHRGVERMGGRVGLESELGKGSRFWVELPKA